MNERISNLFPGVIMVIRHWYWAYSGLLLICNILRKLLF